jgi:hypothetical protein
MNKKDIFNGFSLLVAIVCLLTFMLNMINGRFLLGDFRVYYTATANFFSGGPVYLVSFYTGSGFYKYSPVTLIFFLPYMCFNYHTAAIIHFFILGATYWYLFVVIGKMMQDYFLIRRGKYDAWLLSISFICIVIHLTRELYLGNINIILLLLSYLAIRNFLPGKNLQGGILLGIVILAKPYLLILMLPLVLRRKWKALTWLSFTITCGLIIPFIFPGPLKSIGMYRDWIKTVLMHSGDFPGMTSLDYLLRHLFPAWPVWGILLIFFSVISMVAIFILSNIHNEKPEGKLSGMSPMDFSFEWFLLLALLPNLIRTDWVLLQFSAPVIIFMVFCISARKLYWWIPVLVLLLFFYGANSDDLLGRDISRAILHSGLMGLSNFFLVLVSLFMFLDLRKRAAAI